MVRTKRLLALFACSALGLVTAFGLAGRAGSDNSFGPKVSDALAAAATAPGVTSSTSLHAIVHGGDLTTANADLGSSMTVRQAMGALGGESVSVLEGSLSRSGLRRSSAACRQASAAPA